MMTTLADAPEILDREFLEIRGKLLEVAAALDRIARAPGSVDADPRIQKIGQTLGLLASPGTDRAEQTQLIFSLPYDDAWRDKSFPAQK